MHDFHLNRRQAVTSGAAALLGLGMALRPALAEMSESYESDDGYLEVTWDPELWKPDPETEPGERKILLHDLEYEKYGDDTYYLSISTVQPSFGDAAPADAIELHIDEWFSQGMLTSEIVDRWVSDDTFGYLFTSGNEGNRTFIIFDFREIPEEPGTWIQVSLTIDQVLFDSDITAERLDAVQVNDESLIRERSTEDLIKRFEEHFG